MKKSKNRILLGLLILLISFFTVLHFSPISVYAADEKNEEEKNDDKDDEEKKQQEECDKFKADKLPYFHTRYGATIDYNPEADDNGNYWFTLKMDIPNDMWSRFSSKNVKFKVSEVKITDIPGKTVTYDNLPKDLRVRATISSADELRTQLGIATDAKLTNDKNLKLKNIFPNDPVKYFVVLVPEGFEDKDFVKACGTKVGFSLVLEYDAFGKSIHHGENLGSDPEPMPASTGLIDCSGDYKTRFKDSKYAFELAFCNDYKAAEAAKVKVYKFTNEKPTFATLTGNKKATFTCDAIEAIDGKDNSKKEYYSSKNTSYLLGEIEYSITNAHYTYNYGGQVQSGDNVGTAVDEKNIVTEPATCKVTCKEVVKVEYGRPVASKAGFCFEYKVKVTSRVNCSVTQPPNPPKKDETYCTPAPGCNHGNGYVDKASGPSEDFDACIQECDGGKYSSKCNRKCYKEVYGSTSKKTVGDINFFDTVTQIYANDTVDRDFEHEGEGYYYRINGNVIWKPGNHLGRWYIEANYKGSHRCLKTEAQGGGILAVCGCGARCRWNGCKGNVYLNPGEAKRDYDKNKEVYEQVKKACEAYSKCSTTQAEFSFDVDYLYEKNNKLEKSTIYFPYTAKNDKSAKDTIQYDSGSKTVKCTKDQPNSTLLGSNGCYKCGSGSTNDSTGSSNNWYQTEWSFPGTWINMKTGQISYTPQSKGWQKYEKRFCVPLDAANVNEKWWNAYYVRLYGKDKSYAYNDDDYINKISDNKCIVTSCNPDDFSDKDKIDYNIHGRARKFGLFAWDIDVDCFYALNTDFPFYPGGSTCSAKGCEGGVSKNVRSVDLGNLFPATSGAPLTSSDTTGRAPGFNWSSHASQIAKDPDYVSRPAAYTAWVQKTGYNVYSDEYLDYDVTLTKDIIRTLRNEKHNYTDFKGSTTVASVTNYRSPLFDKGGLLSDQPHPNAKALQCNNMKNYKSSECEEFQG